mgnify:CR=1 FL=1
MRCIGKTSGEKIKKYANLREKRLKRKIDYDILKMMKSKEEENKMKVLNTIGKIIYRFMVIIVILMLIFAILQKTSDNKFSIGGIKIFAVITGSMIPVYKAIKIADIYSVSIVISSVVNAFPR